MKSIAALFAPALALCLVGSAALAGDPAVARQALLTGFADAARAEDSSFAGFEAARGRSLLETDWGLGKPDTPACTTCHGPDPRRAGQTRAGKPIEPLAVSVSPQRFTDPEEVAKWFFRNCRSVLGRECSAQEKGDFITFMAER